MSGDRRPGIDTIVGISRALNMTTDDVIRQAGLLPPKRGLTADDQRAFDDFVATVSTLTPANQRLVFDLVERIKRSEEASR